MENMEILKDPNVLEKIISTRDAISKANAISRNTVVSLEGFLGFGLITKEININKFTSNESSPMCDSVVSILDRVISENKTNNFSEMVTLVDIVKKANEVRSSISTATYLMSDFGKVTKETWDRIFNEKYIYYYKDFEDNDEVEIYNYTKDSDILWAFAYNKSYITGVCTTVSGGLDVNKINNIYEFVNEIFNETSYGPKHYQLFSFLDYVSNRESEFYISNYSPVDFSLKSYDIEKVYNCIFKNKDSIITRLNGLVSNLDGIVSDTNRADYYQYYDNDYLKDLYKNLSDLDNIFKDETSLNILRLFNIINN